VLLLSGSLSGLQNRICAVFSAVFSDRSERFRVALERAFHALAGGGRVALARPK